MLISVKIITIKSPSIEIAKKLLKDKYPDSYILFYKFMKDYRFQRPKDYINRKMKIIFISDRKIIKDLLK